MPSHFKTVINLALTAALLSGFTLKTASAAPGEAPAAHASPLKRLVVLDFELTGDAGGQRFTAEHPQRLKMIGAKLREELERNHLYDVIDDSAALSLLAEMNAQQNLHHCNGCELDLAKQLQADYILLPSVFRMSYLVLTLHVEIKDTSTGRIVMKKALDFRGDNDNGWLHAITYLINDMKRRNNHA